MEDVFWTDERVKEFVIVYNKVDKLITGIDPIMQTIKEFKESRTILFTTNDGVDIIEGDSYWHVTEYWTVVKADVARSGDNMRAIAETFSTKEAANEWIVMNKPCLSIKDFMGIVGEGISWYEQQLLQATVKAKLHDQ